MADNIFFIDSDYAIQKVSRRLAQQIGIEHGGQLVGKRCFNYFYHLDQPCSGCPVSRSITFKTVVEEDIPVAGQNSHSDIRHAVATPVIDDYNDVRQVIVACLGVETLLHSNVSEAVGSANQERKAVAQLPIEHTEANAADVICAMLVDKELNIILSNQWQAAPGFGKGEASVGQNLFSAAPFYNQEPVRTKIKEFIAHDNEQQTVFQTKADIYSDHWLEHQIYNLLGQSRIEAWLIISKQSRDASSTNSTALLADKVAMLSRFASRISHDIKNPLALISTSVDFLKSDLANVNTLDGVHKLEEYIDQVQDQVNRVVDLLDTVNALKVHSMDTIAETDAAELLDRCVTIALLSKSFPGNEIEMNIAGPLPPIYAHEINLERALSELFKSLLKNGGEHGRLEINLAYVGDLDEQFIFKIHTNIVQQTALDLDELLNEFFTSGNRFNIENLGLIIAYATIINHSGEMRVLTLDTGELEVLIKLPRVAQGN